MKRKKINISAISSSLSRSEMRQIMAGSSGGLCGKCCWDSQPWNCSSCVEISQACSPGAHLVDCCEPEPGCCVV